MHYDSKKVARERAIRDSISLVLIVLIGIGLVIYAIVLQKQVIDADMQEYEQLSQQVQPTEASLNVLPEQTVQLLQPVETNISVQQTTDDAGQPTTEPVTESSPMPAIVLPDLSTATIAPTNEIATMAQPTVKPADSNVAPALKPGATEIQPGSTPQPVTGKTGADLVTCKAANDDFIAWLKIPGTKINYPVVLTDNVDYYLTHTFTGKQSKIGTLFSLGRTDYETPGQNIAVYGHHITTGGGNMFQPLLSYKKQSFWEKHQTVYFDKGKTITQMGWKIPEATFRGSLGYRAKAEPSDEDYKLPDLRVGQELSPCMSAVKEGRTNPPGHYTEDTLLVAMESAGADQAPEDAERRGLGTPATRAGIVEKMIASGLVERRGDKKSKYLLPTEKGKALIAVLPEQIKSPVLTAEWENRLKAVERGEANADSFMAGITNLLTDMVSTARPIPGAENLFPSNKRKVGVCPHCGADVVESGKGYFCRNKSCKFKLWKDIHFLSDGRTLTPQMAAELLEKKKIFMPGLVSRRTGKRFDADLCLGMEEDGSASYHLEFSKEK